MDAPTTFFLLILLVQISFTGTIVWLVGRRFPKRLPLYRFVAPAGVPLLMFALVASVFVSTELVRERAGAPFGMAMLSPLARIFLAYSVLWLVGVLVASLIIRLTRR